MKGRLHGLMSTSRSSSVPSSDREDLARPEDVRALAISLVRTLPAFPVALADAGGLVLSEPLTAPFRLPPFDNAAMDGFAVRAADTAGAPVRLRVVGGSFAGHPSATPIGPGEAAPIGTGASIPDGADAVVRVERTEPGDLEVTVRVAVEAGADIRRAGEDVGEGTVVLEQGTVLGPGQIAAAAAFGFDAVPVYRRPLVALVPTGDEIVPPGLPLRPGQAYDAVSAPLSMLLREVGAIPCWSAVAPDEPDALAASLERAARDADALITVGGASMGQRDLIRSLAAEGEVQAFMVALRPAKPFVGGRIFGVPMFGLPGNPASALAAFEEFVRPAVLAMMGREPVTRATVRATLTQPLHQRPGRLHLARVQVWRAGDRLLARSAGSQGSGMIGSLARAQGWAVVPPEVEELPAGAPVDVRLLIDPS
jgi:molybdopterin molybdotransferase